MTVVIADNQLRITAHDRDRPRFASPTDAPDIDDTAYSRAATAATTGLFGDRTIGRCGNGRPVAQAIFS